MSEPKILVAGGGPGGATVAAILAKEGAQVTLVERARFPRHHVGESLQPASFDLLDFHLGLGPLMVSQGFPLKFGAIYEWGETAQRWHVLFDERLADGADHLDREALLSGEYVHAYQVQRSVFDQILLDHAAARGVVVRQGVEARAPVMDGDKVTGLVVRGPDGEETLSADLVIDATGTRCLMGRHLGLTQEVSDLQATATYAYYEGAGGADETLGRSVQIVVTVPEGWVWFIPVSETRTSVGVVTHERRKLSPEHFADILSRTTLPMEGATLLPGPKGSPFRHEKDWSYTHSQFVGDGWMMVGDAACFTDPILSGGVDFAIRGACNAAVAVLGAAAEPGETRAIMASYQNRLKEEFAAYLKLARYWYGNNRAVEGLFWKMHEFIPVSSISTPLRAFVYQTSGECDADAHFHVFSQAQEKKIFQNLSVDPSQVRDALRRARRHLQIRRQTED
jgi:flavin-dependent dehydrogenase